MSKKKWKKPINTFLATTMIASVVVPSAPLVAKAEAIATDLIISEYIEGSSFNKAIEIYNGTGAPVDLSNYTLELHVNGTEAVGATVTLSGVLESGDVYVVYHKDANDAIKSVGDLENSAVMNFNGNDPIILKKNGETIDSIGQIGSSADFAKDQTFVRKSAVHSGNASFNPDEWDKLSKDDTTNLGFHLMDGTSGEPGGENPEEPGEPGEENPEEPGEPGGEDPEIPVDPETPSVAVISISDARTKQSGERVVIKGVVAAGLKNTFSVQDETGGIAIRPTSLDIRVGDEVTLEGTLQEYRGLLQLDSTTIVEKGQNVGAPAPKEITGADVNESNESLLVTVKNVELTAVAGTSWKNYTANDGSTFIVRDETGGFGSLTVGTTYESITGIVQQFDNDYQIIPRSEQDIVADSTTLKPATANPASGTYVGPQSVELSTTSAGAEIYYTLDGTEPTVNSAKYDSPIKISKSTAIKAIVKAQDGTVSEVSTFNYTITDALQIHDIQGEGHTSPFVGQVVDGIQGVVTYTYTIGSGNYFHLQTPDELKDDNPNTSDAIIVYTGNKKPAAVGDLVNVTGTVDEYHIDGYNDTKKDTDLSVTQINARDDRGGLIVKVASNVELPAAVTIDASNLPSEFIDSDGLTIFNPEVDAIDFWESLEGMRVQVGNVKAVSPQEHGDLITVLEDRKTDTIHGGVKLTETTANPDRIQFKLFDNNTARNFEVATGDRFTGPIEGVVNYGFQNYKIYADYEYMREKYVKGDTKPETTTIVKKDDKLTIASYNLENFSNNRKETTDDKAQKLARAFVKDMKSPDIIGVTEVQDNNGASAGDAKADESYQRLIDAIKAAGGPEYKYLNIDPVNNEDGGAPNANIRVGFLYNPERVTLPEGIKAGDATSTVAYKNGKLTLNPGRIDPTNPAFNSSRKPLAAQFNFQGEEVVVIVNHWNSKSGDTPLFGSTQPPIYGSEEQRKEIAKVVNNFVEEIKKDNPKANIVSVGDFNDFQFTESLKIHEGQHMTNMINLVDDNDRYTYLFQGNSQVLDHILVSNNLVKNTEIDILHINADFTDMAGRASDHDPVMVQIDLKGTGEVETPITAEKEYNFTSYKTNKLTITKPSVAVSLDADSVITDGILFKGEYAEFQGAGFAGAVLTVQPEKTGAVIDFKGTKVKKVIIDGPNVKELRGVENVEEIEYTNGATANTIKFTDSKGDPIADPSFPSENKAPVVSKPIGNQTLVVGGKVSIDLSEHFSDPDGDNLSYSATKGMVKDNSLTLELEEGSHIVGVTATDGEKSVTAQFTVTVTAPEAPNDDYYKDARGKTGQELKAALHEIIDDHKQLSYNEAWEALKETDEDPKNPANVILFYSNRSISKNSNGGNVGQWNREHTWAKSHGDFGTSKGPGTDIHHLRPTDVQVNGARGNLDFDNGGSPVTGCSGCFKDSDSFEPPDRIKGDVARILFYMATRYEQGDRVDLELNDRVNNGKNPYHGKLSVLLQWHKQDPVDDFERNRNNVIQEWQGNRNPFIDHPEWAELIWR
ncbi:endonuclease [Ureibacillus sinduriensis]|uniref:Endonuclease/exonuclease/phosphatase n=1 Tax=Ureibacillus sinduriensis BLB-1 = JCM 15800 TaxID=1384057 RepID=A0A0A3HTT9_9BACL|nr:endonuclease [Ureibacillus sinduriensis]KGR76006.1 endonuclease/exonuclease/phosphatase [Ureibacillus sinduriensis BLB-1 = JCM 15800]